MGPGLRLRGRGLARSPAVLRAGARGRGNAAVNIDFRREKVNNGGRWEGYQTAVVISARLGRRHRLKRFPREDRKHHDGLRST